MNSLREELSAEFVKYENMRKTVNENYHDVDDLKLKL